MMSRFLRRVALLLLPVLVQPLVLPTDISENIVHSDTLRSEYRESSYGGPSTFFEYDLDDQSIKFAIPCPDCSDEEKELLRQEIISVKPTIQNTRHCTVTDPIGLEIDGEQIFPSKESDLAFQSHIGALNLINHSKHHILNRTRWINHCGCTKGHPDDCDEDFQSSFSFEVLGLPSGQIPGFTVSYKQYGRPEVLRFSTFPDIGIATSSRFGQSAHYQSPPLLRVQKATTPSSSPILSFTSFLPSTTIPTSFPSYTQSDQVSDEVHQTSQNILGLVSEPLISSPQTSNIPFIHRVGHEIKEWCRRPGLFTSLGHGIEGLAVKTKSSAQTFLGIFQNIIPSPHLDMSNQPLAVSKEDSNTGGIVSHDEPDDNYQGTEVGSDSFYVDLPNTASSFLDNPISVKAIQAASVAFIIFALSGSILALVCRDPRLRAKLAAAIEENRNQRLYRHAARKRRFQNFVSRFRSKCPDDEEKKANDLASSTVQQSYALNWTEWEKRVSMESVRYNNQEKDMYAISRDLLAFRKAHQFVDSIITTQETRQISGQFRRDRSTRRSRYQRRYSIGSEKTAPPPYESDGEDFILDADGPRYVMIGRSPESSVISTSPRSSCVDSDSEGGC